jgi:hypothetical protein
VRYLLYAAASALIAHHLRSWSIYFGVYFFAMGFDDLFCRLRDEIKLCRHLLERMARK